MDHSSGQHQEIPSHSLENMLVCPKSQQEQQQRKPRPQPDQSPKCPRCDSSNTKFCYYNNYSLTQPRYFCKSCRRYWTKGGTLRNVPVGGGCRKNKRSSSSSSSSSYKRSQDQPFINLSSNIPLSTLPISLPYDSNDLTLAFARLQKQGFTDHQDLSFLGNSGFHGLKTGFLENQSGFQGMYEGFGDVKIGEVENGGGDQIGLAYEELFMRNSSTAGVATMKEEVMCDGENRMLWGFPWQINHGDGNVGDWNGSGNGIASSWHGLLNSTPLM